MTDSLATRRKAAVMTELVTLWEVRRDGVIWSAHLRSHGPGSGWEVMILKNGTLVIREQFPVKANAVRWAKLEKADVEKAMSL